MISLKNINRRWDTGEVLESFTTTTETLQNVIIIIIIFFYHFLNFYMMGSLCNTDMGRFLLRCFKIHF